MPILNFTFTQGTLGPVIDAYVGPTTASITAGHQGVAGVPVRLLVDTGASASVFASSVFEKLSLTPTGFGEMITPSTGGGVHDCLAFDVAVTLDAKDSTTPLVIEPLNVLSTDLAAHGIDGLIGRDILGRCHLSYNGTTGQCSLAF